MRAFSHLQMFNTLQKALILRDLGSNYHGSMRVLETMLNSEFLHDRVRAKGGVPMVVTFPLENQAT